MIRYLISSHFRYAPHTLPRLLPTLTAQIEPERIVVVVGGSAAPGVTHPAGIAHYAVTHNSFDYTSPIAVLEEGLASDWWFWLHDTCAAGPRFRELVETGFDPADPITGAGWHSLGMPYANLGLYSQPAFETARADLLALKDCTKQQACEGDGVCWRAVHGAAATRPETRRVYPGPEVEPGPAADRYGTGTLRRRSYLPAVDLYKDQANWGMGGWHVDP